MFCSFSYNLLRIIEKKVNQNSKGNLSDRSNIKTIVNVTKKLDIVECECGFDVIDYFTV
jgi:hypothetical protein